MTTVEIFVSIGGLVLGYLIVSKLLITPKNTHVSMDSYKIIEPRK